MPAVPNQTQDQPTRRQYVGLMFEDWTPQVEAQILKDVQQLLSVCARGEELVIVCPESNPDPVLRQLGVRRVPTIQAADMWIVYRTREFWPQPHDWCKTEIRRDMYVAPGRTNRLLQVDPDQANGYYLPPQGRLSPDTLSLERPAPNGYIPTDPGLIMIWSSVVARLKDGS